MDISEKVYNALAAEHGIGVAGPSGTAHRFPSRPHDQELTNLELDCIDWGVAFGIAYGIARGEDAFESEQSVTERALAAARIAYERWGGATIFTNEAFLSDRAERTAA